MARGGAASQFSKMRFGRATRPVERVESVDTSVEEILTLNPDRISWLLVNRGTNNVAWSTRRDLTFANGVLLASGGGTAQMTAEDDGESVAYPIFIISTVGASDIRILEVIAYGADDA